MLSSEDIKTLDDRYVQKDDCNDKHTATAKEISSIATTLVGIGTKLNLLVWIAAAVGGLSITTICGKILASILK